ncbi:hypothetical protein K488DRAFT_76734 [Vararia minispora EC-137]|uniref:Uncharacterized protein n=1 Tax=Vararia minispora EC-137 TaxID=1314806 RepID=A0ACB8QUD1_9AGAM|nr:hypothetical protein K488DRAFT_76734 [Vararia minispora EC-137]
MKGFTKAIKRTPHMLTSTVGISKKSNDPEFDDYQRNFTQIEKATDKLLKETKTFTDAVTSLFTSGASFAEHFAALFRPIQGEYDILGKFPDATATSRNVDTYHNVLDELRQTVVPELELIESRVVGPTKELQTQLKVIRKFITKRDHKLVDYDRYNNSLTKLREKKEKSLKDEQNLFKLEQDFEIASNEYEYINSTLKQDLPRFFVLATRFVDPLFHSFFYMQLNIFYLILEKLNSFVDGKYDVSVAPAQIAVDWEARRGDAQQQVEAMSIVQKFISTSRLVAQNRSLSAGSSAALGRAPSTASASSASSGTFAKKMPPPPPSFGSKSGGSYVPRSPAPPSSAPVPAAAPPPYQPPAHENEAAAAATAAATKRAPPPPPLKPKPKSAAQYVVALYDFTAQADGDLDFKVGDRIEVVERTTSQEDWWTGRLDGRQGVFPGNYVQEA